MKLMKSLIRISPNKAEKPTGCRSAAVSSSTSRSTFLYSTRCGWSATQPRSGEKVIPLENSGFFVPKGHHENSPAFQSRGLQEGERVPKGRLTRREISTVPSGLIRCSPMPGVQTPGYYRKSLRDKRVMPLIWRFRSFNLLLFAMLTVALIVGCGKQSSNNANTPAEKAKKFYWVQPLKGHPVHQMTQIAFIDGCKKLGYETEIIGTDQPDIGGTIALAEQALAKGDAAGMAIWTGNPAWNPFIEKAGKAGLPIILPHFPVAEGSIPGAAGVISADPADYAREAAREIGKAIGGKGTVAITQGSFNSTENLVAEVFAKTIKELYPTIKVLPSQEEGFDAPKAISTATSILQANPDVTAALSTTGNGTTTWAGAQREAGRKIVAVAMDYTRVNLDLVKDGSIYAVIAQPLWEESYGAAELLDKIVKGEKIPWWTKLPAPFVTKDKTEPYMAILDKVEAAIKR
ncbi:MAG: sugar ABC transporter substrate-binding protein [Verrucomicrobiota bacterium]